MINLIPNLDTTSSKPFYMQIYEHVKKEILSGNLAANSKLPSIRDFSSNTNLSKNTIDAAYQQLIAEGYIRSKSKSGFFVENIEQIPENLSSMDYNSSLKQSKIKEEFCLYDFTNGQIDLDSFPLSTLRKIINESLLTTEKDLLFYGEHVGDKGLRFEISKYIYQSRGVLSSPEQIIIGSGTQQSLSLLSLVLQKFDKNLAFEDPGYIGARNVFEHYGFDIASIPVDENGICINKLKESKSKIVYITPSHQFPLGRVMPIKRRVELLNWALKENSYIIEDDYDGEFRYKGKPIPSLQSLVSNNRVIYLGTFSKSLMPSIRISYMVLPKELMEIYKNNFTIYEQPVPRIIQKSLEIFIKEGHWYKHLKKCRNVYKKKHDLLISSIYKYFGPKAEVIGADSGLHILLKVNNGMDETNLISAAKGLGVKVSPTSIYYSFPKKSNPQLIFLGFAGIKLENIPKGIELLSTAWL
ncbi:PLP-dependent aminotransferase family protein [Clostridium grantii]|uniref:GntR family transcriptional regulator / MocR family aminotransferase n=1 Tax=Clostridium grantii DSM 8605 TaxID=1121316 RepID=A0A1M5QG45_9CLOT|nr:PLP-dependent aminotransferase family protein [Clostridium grantii]SHH12729.1 GntR family transcriptional regulator / MocR family aminotransferase [Clostridium grantii DSM 8605]